MGIFHRNTCGTCCKERVIMLLVSQLKVRPDYTEKELHKKISSVLKINLDDIIDIQIEKRSIDARKKPDVFFVLSLRVKVKSEEKVLKKNKSNSNVCLYEPVRYTFNVTGGESLAHSPVIVGAGPAGLFAAYFLAKNGYKPIVIERGFDVDTRTRDVEAFFDGKPLKKNSNVLFGEGGAGTFSDGKLNTLVKDKNGRSKEVLNIFIKYGAKPEIAYDAKPHLGTDALRNIIKAMREDIKKMGGKFIFNACMTDIFFNDSRVAGIEINGESRIDCEVLILAIGHSARDTYELLNRLNVSLEQKEFAVGFRIEHKQKLINDALISKDPDIIKLTGPAAYKLTYNTDDNRGVYSFCMCPGGYVVNASSEENRLCVNGMSYSGRNGENANSAIVVSVKKEDFKDDSPLSGIAFQRDLEEKAYNAGNGKIPVQKYKDFKHDVLGESEHRDKDADDYASVSPMTKGAYTYGPVSSILPADLSKKIIDGIEYFDKIIPGFASDSAILSGVESRTSSPVRITRDESFESISHKGIYPSGEGAGYAGGITSAAMDGMKIAEKIASIYKPLEV